MDEDDSCFGDFILSVAWQDGILGGVYFSQQTLELSVVSETVDTRPDFTFLNNLMRLLSPSYFILNGQQNFTSQVLKKLQIPSNAAVFRSGRKRGQNGADASSNIAVFSHDSRQLPAARERILKLDVPGMPAGLTPADKAIFMSSVLPLEQHLVVLSLSNLVEILDKNFKNVYYRGSVVITAILTHRMESQMLMDLTSLLGLQVFSPGANLMAQKKCNLFNLLNQCSSHSGMVELKEIMMQPIRDMEELQRRQATIEFCLQPSNFEFVSEVRQNLRKIRNLPLLFTKLVLHAGRAADLKSFKRSIYHAFLICERCNEDGISQDGTFFESVKLELARSQAIKNVLLAIEYVVDLEASELENRFVAKRGVDAKLDESRDLLEAVKGQVFNATQDVAEIPGTVSEFFIAFMTGLGFLVAVELTNPSMEVTLNTSSGQPIEVVYRSEGIVYFSTPYCEELNQNYGHLHGEIGFLESRIFDNLVKYLRESLPNLTRVNKLCGKLDCMISFASVAMQRGFVRPELTDEKCVVIEDGRHPLIELSSQYVPLNHRIDADNGLITILSAPNAFGKSVFMKSVALICYMAHIGSFVPASRVKLGLLDSIYSRIYCLESVEQGESSYMSDVRQMSRIIMNSTTRSLILVDEFGKGTNVREGQALLASCLEELISRADLAPLTIITTHYVDVLRVVRASSLVRMKTIRGEEGQSSYEVVPGVHEGGRFGNYADTSEVIERILKRNPISATVDFDSVYKQTTLEYFEVGLRIMKALRDKKDLQIEELYEIYSQGMARAQPEPSTNLAPDFLKC